MSQANLSFLDSINYLKRDPNLSGSGAVTLGGAGTTASRTITHSLGYIPFVTVGADIKADGTVWANDIVNQYTQTSLSGTNPPFPTLNYYVTTTTLVISLINNTSPASSGSRTVYWAIYLDYGAVA